MKEFRKFLGQLFLSAAFEILPSSEFKTNLAEFISKNLMKL